MIVSTQAVFATRQKVFVIQKDRIPIKQARESIIDEWNVRLL